MSIWTCKNCGLLCVLESKGQKRPERKLKVFIVKCHGLHNLVPIYLYNFLAMVKHSQTSCLAGPRTFLLPFSAWRTPSLFWDTAQISPILWSHFWQHHYLLKAELIHPSFTWSQPPIMTFNTLQKRMCKLSGHSSHSNLLMVRALFTHPCP